MAPVGERSARLLQRGSGRCTALQQPFARSKVMQDVTGTL